MKELIIAWDFGTGGNKASLYDSEGNCLVSAFVSYDTKYPKHGWHEQRPEDWWDAIVTSTQKLFSMTDADPRAVVACGISGHSLGAVPIDAKGNLIAEYTPIWSDTRAMQQAANVFKNYSEEDWYMLTGNGFTPAMYTAFKILWYKENEPELFNKIYKLIGTKDYVNFRLTGKLVTDPSYASGSGVWDLKGWKYSDLLIDAMGIPSAILPEVVPSTEVIGTITREAAEQLGLSENVKVVAGGVDNSCMALGAKAFKEGRIYNNLGSCSWIAVSSQEPLLEAKSRPYVFSHVVPGYFVSALCITTGGSCYRWLRDQLCEEMIKQAEAEGVDVYDLMTAQAAKSPLGANKLIFNPSLGGGMPMDKSPNIRGAYFGLDLSHTRADIHRATMEGTTFGLRACLDRLRELGPVGDEMLLVGGGSKSALWRQIYADIYRCRVLKSNIDQQAAALGAAACAAVGIGLWDDFDKIDSLHTIEEIVDPIPENVEKYNKLMEVFYAGSDCLSDLGDRLAELEL